MTLSSCGYQIVEESANLPAEMLSGLVQTDDEGREAFVLAPAAEEEPAQTAGQRTARRIDPYARAHPRAHGGTYA